MNPSPKYFQYNVIHKVSWLFELQQTHSTQPPSLSYGPNLEKPNDRLLFSQEEPSAKQSLVNKALVIPHDYAARA